MTRRATLTQADIERAIRAAKRQGCDAVDVRGDSIRILVNAPAHVQPSPQITGENTCDAVFGAGSG